MVDSEQRHEILKADRQLSRYTDQGESFGANRCLPALPFKVVVGQDASSP
jgi:hypothetical protein